MTHASPRDLDLVHAVDAALVRSPAVDPARIRVSARAGRVRLEGRIATHAQRLAAATVAAEVPGVAGVVNELAVDEIETDATRTADAELAEDVRDAIAASTIAVADLGVAVRQRVATLTGRVATARDRAALRRTVQDVSGVHFVDARLDVDGETATGVEELTPDASLALLAHGDFGRLAVADGPGVDIFPVNYVLHDDALYLRSAPGTKLVRIADAPDVAFEIDGRDGDELWSVVVRGRAERLDDDAEILASGVRDLAGPHPSEKLNYVRIRPRVVTGRRFRAVR